MGEARETMNRLTEALFANDLEALKELYAEDAVAETPDQGTLVGRDAIVAWLEEFIVAFPDATFEEGPAHESGDTAIDEGFFTGTHTGPLKAPDGTTIDPTGKSVRVRACDIATVKDRKVTSHRFYFDQIEFLTQLGLLPAG